MIFSVVYGLVCPPLMMGIEGEGKVGEGMGQNAARFCCRAQGV